MARRRRNLRNFAMATLTTVDGIQITFVAKTVSAMADHDANTGFAVTCVYGVTKGALQISESVQDFMKRVRITKDFAQLTRPNGFPIWINGSAVSSIRSPLPNEYVAGVNTVVFTDSLTQGVKESPADVTAAINDHSGDL
jgi:hypothetical protein